MWHASVASQVLRAAIRRKLAYKALAGVGIETIDWTEDRPIAFHLRRRVTAAELKQVGNVVDLRGTPEAFARLEAIRSVLPYPALRMAAQEIG